MLLHQLTTKKSKSRKRVGRGSHRGTLSGRGVKGQKSRAGGTPRPQLRDFLKKLPKRRGWKQKPGLRVRIVNVATLDRAFNEGETVTIEELERRNLISTPRRSKISSDVKVLGQGDITKKLTIEDDIVFSASARAKLTKAGCSIAEEQT